MSDINKEPVYQINFNNSRNVVCGKCNGTKVTVINNKLCKCSQCNGVGILERVTEGVLKLYQIDES